MENVSDALKMAFAIFVFIIALSMVFFLLTEVKTTADSILFDADKTNYFEWETGSLENGRIVGIDTVISTLKNYTTQSTYVIVEDERGSTEYNFNTSKEEIESFINSNIRSTAQYLENIREIENNVAQKDIIKRFITTICFEKILTPINLTYIECVILLGAISIIAYKIQVKVKRKKFLLYQIGLFIGIIIYTISLLLTYLFIIPEIESVQIASYERYIGTIFLGNIIFLFAITTNRKTKISKSKMIIILCIFTIICPFNNILARLTDDNDEIEKEILNRRYISQIVEYKGNLEQTDKIYYFSNKGSEAKKKLYISRYLMMPFKIENKEIKIENEEKFKSMLKEEKYTHIYLFELTDNAIELYKKMFPEANIKEKTMYKIENHNGQLELIEIEGEN